MMKTLIKISSLALLLPAIAIAAPKTQGPVGLFELKGNLSITAPVISTDPNSNDISSAAWEIQGGMAGGAGVQPGWPFTGTFSSSFDTVYLVGKEHAVQVMARVFQPRHSSSDCSCTFSIFTDASGTTYINGSSTSGSKDCPGSGSSPKPYKSGVCLVDGKQSASSSDPNYTPKLTAQFSF